MSETMVMDGPTDMKEVLENRITKKIKEEGHVTADNGWTRSATRGSCLRTWFRCWGRTAT